MLHFCQKEKTEHFSPTFKFLLVYPNHAFQFYFTLIPRIIYIYFFSNQLITQLLLSYFCYLLLCNHTPQIQKHEQQQPFSLVVSHGSWGCLNDAGYSWLGLPIQLKRGCSLRSSLVAHVVHKLGRCENLRDESADLLRHLHIPPGSFSMFTPQQGSFKVFRVLDGSLELFSHMYPKRGSQAEAGTHFMIQPWRSYTIILLHSICYKQVTKAKLYLRVWNQTPTLD